MNISIHENIKQVMPDCRLGYVVMNDINVRGTPPALLQEFSLLQEQVAKAYNMDILSAMSPMSPVMAMRSLAKKPEFDSSRYRPEAETLVRRVLKNRELYYVNSAVDVINYCSIKYLVPFGLYDLDKIDGKVEYTLAEDGMYVNIAGHAFSTGAKPFLADKIGVFGNPHSDSQRTAVTLATRNILSVVYADNEIENDFFIDILDFTAQMMVRYNGGTVREKNIVHT